MPGDQLTYLQGAGLVLMVVGGVLVCVWAFYWMLDGILSLAAAFLLIVVGSVFLDWKVALIIFGLPVAWLLTYSMREASYARRFPVFVGSPMETVREENGSEHHFYVREWQSDFIIGVDYEQEVDGTMVRYKTRWKDRFPSRESAEIELRRRFAEWQAEGVMRGSLE